MDELGFILINRNLINSDVFASQKLLKIWIWCLCKANYKNRSVPLKTGKGEQIVSVKRSQFIFGRFKAEEELFIDGSTIYKSMQKLKDMEMIKIDSNNQYSIITICNYDKYQTPKNNKVTSKEQGSNSEVTAKSQVSNTDNKVNKDNKVKEIKNTLLSDLKKSDFDDSAYFDITISFYELFKNNLKELEISTATLEKAKGSWIDSIRLMIEVDKHKIEDFRDIFRFLQIDNFWKKNILSAKKLREKFPQLLINARQNEKNKSNNGCTFKEFEQVVRKHFS